MKKWICLILGIAIFLSVVSCSEVKDQEDETTDPVSDKTTDPISDETADPVPYEIMVPGYEKLPAIIEKERFEKDILKPMYKACLPEGVEMTFEEYLILKNSEDDSDRQEALSTEGFEFSRFSSFYVLWDLEDPELTAEVRSILRTDYPITERMAVYVFDLDSSRLHRSYLEGYITKYTDYEPITVSFGSNKPKGKAVKVKSVQILDCTDAYDGDWIISDDFGAPKSKVLYQGSVNAYVPKGEEMTLAHLLNGIAYEIDHALSCDGGGRPVQIFEKTNGEISSDWQLAWCCYVDGVELGPADLLPPITENSEIIFRFQYPDSF